MLPRIARVSVTNRAWDYDRPWSYEGTTQTGTAVAIGETLLLTSADLVAHAIEVRIQAPGDPQSQPAWIAAVDHDRALAVLDTATPSVWHELGALPNLNDDCTVVGFAGDDLVPRTTPARVANISVERYAHSQRHALTMSIDAQSADGFAGAPALVGDAIAGIVMQRRTDDAQCELVPAPIIHAFRAGVLAGKPLGLPALGVTTQNLQNPHLRSRLKLPAHTSGVLVIAVDHGQSADGVLDLGDVITSIDGLPISSTGTVAFGPHTVRYDVVLGTRHIGDRLRLDIFREGSTRTVDLVLTPWRPLVPRSCHDRAPRYLVYGGLLFQPLTRDYLTTWNEWWNQAPKEFLHHYYLGVRTPDRQELIALTTILVDDINIGYNHLYNELVATIDGIRPRDMDDFATRLSRAHGHVEILTTSGGRMLLPVDEARRSTENILRRYQIPADRTPGLPT